MDPVAFQKKWIGASNLKEHTASQPHFQDLCDLLGMPKPADVDHTGDTYTFERGAGIIGGGDGWADVWFRGHFAWEYKGRGKDLDAAYLQLLRYKDYLGNPPLMIVSDLNIIRIHTNFTNTEKRTWEFDLNSFTEPDTLTILKRIWTDPDWFNTGKRVEVVTQEAAARFGEIAAGLHQRGEEPARSAHFLMQALFCLFAEDIGLLPKKIFSQMVEMGIRYPDRFRAEAQRLLEAMNTGDFVAYEKIPHINGGLFREVDVPDLVASEIAVLHKAATLDWSAIEPAIFGTLFERSLDPAKRSQLGAHYTGRADIERVVDPVVMIPLRRRWDEVRAEADVLIAAANEASTPRTRTNRRNEFAAKISAFLGELREVRVLDPACGSGNFLYVALERLMNLEKEVMLYRATAGFPLGFPTITPRQVLGLEINEYAQELAQVAIWIGYLQWMIQNGFGWSEPVLDPLETIRLQDALLTERDSGVSETIWPEADFIIGNPPFLGGNRIRQELGDDYLGNLFAVYNGRVPRFADLVCYFFEKSRSQIERDEAERSGLLAANSIRGGVNREVLKRIKETGDVFLAWSDEPWVLDGAAVRISIVGFDDGSATDRQLNGLPVASITSDLTSSEVDITQARRLRENEDIGYQGDTKGGPFEISGSVAHQLNALPTNPNGHPNSDVVRRWITGFDVTRRPQNMWIIDFGTSMPVSEAALYEAPYEYVQQHVRPVREKNAVARTAAQWWIHRRPVPPMRTRLAPLNRYIGTTRHAKHRLFVWLPGDTIPDSALVVFAREDDYFIGVLHSRVHEVWSLRMGTWLGKGNDPRYTPTTCFETFPLPWAPGTEPVDDPRVIAIGDAAKALDRLRTNWLNPEGASEAELKKRTLTNLYNARPQWLQNAHAALDRAVWAAYGWDDPDPATVDEDTLLSRLLALNLERAADQG